MATNVILDKNVSHKPTGLMVRIVLHFFSHSRKVGCHKRLQLCMKQNKRGKNKHIHTLRLHVFTFSHVGWGAPGPLHSWVLTESACPLYNAPNPPRTKATLLVKCCFRPNKAVQLSIFPRVTGLNFRLGSVSFGPVVGVGGVGAEEITKQESCKTS